MNIFLQTLNCAGHIRPMWPLAFELKKRGHAVSWLQAPDPPRADHGDLNFALQLFADYARENPFTVPPATDLMITDATIFGAYDFWKEHKIPWVMFSQVPLILPRPDIPLILQITIPSFEREFPEHKNIHFVGPLVPLDKEHWRPNLCFPKEKFRIHVSQGTFNTDPSDLILPTLEAAKTDEFVWYQHPREINTFIPHSQLMPEMDLFITNGGYGGIAAALQAGIPIISSGTTVDKPLNGKTIARVGNGLNLGKARITKQEIRWAIDEIRRNPSYTQRALELAEECRKFNGPKLAADLVEQLASSPQSLTTETTETLENQKAAS